jgi:hypothetical protein
VTQYSGLYFGGMNWLSKPKSAILLGVDEDVQSIIADMTNNFFHRESLLPP